MHAYIHTSKQNASYIALVMHVCIFVLWCWKLFATSLKQGKGERESLLTRQSQGRSSLWADFQA